MKDIFKIATGISTPLMLAGFISAVLFFILRQVLKSIKAYPTDKLSILKIILNWLGVLALVAIVFGFIGYIFQGAQKHNSIEASDNVAMHGNYNSFAEMPIQIGSDFWTIKNLDFDTYNDGTPIKQAKTKKQWIEYYKNGTPCWCYYDTNSDNSKYGKIYNGHILKKGKELLPKGWHIADLSDYKKIAYDLRLNAPELKSQDSWKTYKDSFSGNGNNKSNYSGLGAGYCTDNFDFLGEGEKTGWWTISPDRLNNDLIYYFYLHNDTDSVFWEPINKGYGFYIRCVKD